jgi:hypothetical protein
VRVGMAAATSPWAPWFSIHVNPFMPPGAFIMRQRGGTPILVVRHRRVMLLLVAELRQRKRLPRKLKKAIKKMRAEEWP